MNNVLILVEGIHDLAVVVKMLKMYGLNKRIIQKKDVLPIWEKLIPKTYPFDGVNLELIAPIPDIRQNEECSVAVVNCGGDAKVSEKLVEYVSNTKMQYLSQLSHILLIVDADHDSYDERCISVKKRICDAGEKGRIFIKNDSVCINDVNVPLLIYVFPEKDAKGNLEDLLIEAAKISYPEVLQLSKKYNDDARRIQKEIKSEQYYKKSIVGCIANTMKPGRANQVSISEDEWITDKTIAGVHGLQSVHNILGQVITTENNY